MYKNNDIEVHIYYQCQGRTQDLSEGVARFFRNKKLIIRNKIKGLGQGFRNNKKIAQEIGTKLKD